MLGGGDDADKRCPELGASGELSSGSGVCWQRVGASGGGTCRFWPPLEDARELLVAGQWSRGGCRTRKRREKDDTTRPGRYISTFFFIVGAHPSLFFYQVSQDCGITAIV